MLFKSAILEADIRAGDLAAQLGWKTQAFKIRVRKFKDLGLTESLEVGYGLSPRGAAYLKTVPRGKSSFKH